MRAVEISVDSTYIAVKLAAKLEKLRFPFLPFTVLNTIFIFSVLEVNSQLSALAHEAFETGNYVDAVELYSRVIEKDPNNQFYNERLGKSYLNTFIDPLYALDYLLLAENAGKIDKDLYLDLAEASTYHLDYDQTLFYLDKFEEEGGVKKKNRARYSKMIQDCIAAQDLLKYPVDVTFSRLDESVNSMYTDYHPFISKDGQALYFTSRRKIKPGQEKEFDGYFPSDIFKTVKTKNGWSEAERLHDAINTTYDEQIVGITDSGDSIFFYIDHVESVGDIYVCAKEVGEFREPKYLGDQVNSLRIESACSISKDGNTLIFSSDRSEGYGELDIYMVKRLSTGEWGRAENLGPEINTPLNEDFPTLSGDGLTMYFSSDGHPGMGGYDLFFSTWDVQNKVWSKPQNLGYPVNSPYDNKTISFNQSGDLAYVTRMEPGSNSQLDIYEVKFNKEIDEDPAVFLINIPAIEDFGEVKPQIEIKNDLDEVVGRYSPSSITGRYVLGLQPGKYYLYIDAEGYQPYTEVLVVNSFHKRQEQNIKLINLQE
ncbi:MAG: hypothetical protein MK086_10795 [Flavobacteriales bacterium]|nr:hypothetical protein [Flavobacteriales bacterium]